MSSSYYSGQINLKKADILTCQSSISTLQSKIKAQETNKTNYINKSDAICDDIAEVKTDSDKVSNFEKTVKFSKEYSEQMDESYWDSNWKTFKRECLDIESDIEETIKENNRALSKLETELSNMNNDLTSLQSSYDTAIAEEKAAADLAEQLRLSSLKPGNTR